MHHGSFFRELSLPMIKTNNLTKYFGSLAAVNAVSFTVGTGEVFGLLGPNGAGKTTTIRMLTTLLAPSSGTASVTGFDVTTEPLKVKKNIGVVPQMLNFDIDLTVAENLEFHGRLHNMKPSDRAARSEELPAFRGPVGKKRHTGRTSFRRHAPQAAHRARPHAPARGHFHG